MVVNPSEQQISIVVDRLDQVKIELLRLRALLLPEEALTPEELKELDESRAEVKDGRFRPLEDMLKELDED
ncbi:MAG: hypothetical protein NTV15_01310 [Candidatus Bathyarchaeota archaeon]|nr:hypothetical protein [Candidatus Bathyarchaeota archaeon]